MDLDACSPNNEVDFQLVDDGDVTTIFTITKDTSEDKIKGLFKVCAIRVFKKKTVGREVNTIKKKTGDINTHVVKWSLLPDDSTGSYITNNKAAALREILRFVFYRFEHQTLIETNLEINLMLGS